MADSESLDADNSVCRSLTSDFGAKFIPPGSGRPVGLKLDNGYSKTNDYNYNMGSMTYRHE